MNLWGGEPADRAARELVRGLIEAASARGLAVSPGDVLDVLWLAAHLPEGGRFLAADAAPPRREPPGTTGRMIPEPGPTPPPRPPAPPASGEEESPGEVVEVPVFPRRAGGPPAGPPLLLPAPAVFPGKRQFLQAWRPLMLRGPSRHRTRPDVAETARRWVDERILEVVERPTSERRVELVLVLDFGPSMDMWRGLMRELAETFRTSGGFRRVTVACRVGGQRGPHLVALKDVGRATAEPVRLDAPEAPGPRLTLVVTDCISSHWRGSDWLGQLDAWARRGAVALLQVLPQEQWPRTALGQAERSQTFAGAPLSPNHRYRTTQSAAEELERWLEAEAGTEPGRASPLLPVASLLQEAGLGRLIQFLGGHTTFPRDCYQLRAHPDAATVRTVEPLVALEAFSRRASARARELATLLAASPVVSLPLARIIRQNFLGIEGGALLEAEVWTSSLLEPLEEVAEDDPEQGLYRFRPGIQQRLLDGAPRSLRQRIVEATSRYIEDNMGRLRGLSAMLADPAVHPGGLRTGPGSDPMAWVAAEVLRRQGGALARVADSFARRPTPVEDLARRAVRYLASGEQPNHRFAWSPDGSTLAIPTMEGRLVLRREGAGPDASEQVSRYGVNQVAWSPDGRLLAVACFSRVVRIFDTSPRRLYQLEGHNTDVTSVAFSPGGGLLASGTAGGTVRIWDLSTRALIASYPAERLGGVRDLLWLDRARVAAGYTHGTRIYRLGPEADVEEELKAGGTALALFTPERAGWLPAAPVLVLGQPNGELQFWDTRSWRKARSLYPHRAYVSSISVSPGARLIASKARDGSVSVLRVGSGKIVATMATEPTSSPYGTVAFRPSSRSYELAVSQAEDRDVVLYNLDPLVSGAASRPLRVRLVGSDTGHGEFSEACYQIGEELGRRGHTLVVCSSSRRSADYHAFLGYVEHANPRGQVVFSRSDTRGADRALRGLEGILEKKVEDREKNLLKVVEALDEAFTPTAIRGLFSILPTLADQPAWPEDPYERSRLLVAVDQAGYLKDLIDAAADRLPGNTLLASLRKRSLNKDRAIELTDARFKSRGNDAVIEAQTSGTVDAVVAIGGGSRTRLVCRIAEGFRMPLVPLAGFDGTAGLVWSQGAAPATEPRSEEPAWMSRLGSDAERSKLWTLTGSPWTAGMAATILELLERTKRPARGGRSLDPVVRIIPGDPAGPQAAGTGVLIDARRVLALASDLLDPATGRPKRVAIAPPGGLPPITATDSILPGDGAGPGYDFGLVMLESPSEGIGPYVELAADEDANLWDAPVRLVSAAADKLVTRRGILQVGSPGVMEVWADEPLPAGGAGTAVLLGAEDQPVLVGLVTRAHDTGDRYQVARVTRQMLERLRGAADQSARPVSSQKVERWVCVTGTGNHELDPAELAASQAVGRMLANLSHGLITGGWPGVDHVVSRAFWERLEELNVRAPEARLVHVMARPYSPDFPHGAVRYVERDEETYLECVKGSHAVIVIGGLGGAKGVAETAIGWGIPVIPLRGTGGDADQLHEEVLRSWADRAPLAISAEQFVRATTWPPSDQGLLPNLLRYLPAERMLSPWLTESVLRIEAPITVDDLPEHHGRWLTSRERHILVRTPPFRLGVYAVRNDEYERFVAAGGYHEKSLWDTRAPVHEFLAQDGRTRGPASWEAGVAPRGRGQHPVSGISYFEAEAFCRWLNGQGTDTPGPRWTLPTEDMWEYAARLRAGPAPTLYPWGDRFEEGRCNWRGSSRGSTTPVGSFPTGNSPDGCADMAGNVWEFTASGQHEHCVLRGGSYKNDRQEIKSSLRLWGVAKEHRPPDFGFRCAFVYPEPDGSAGSGGPSRPAPTSHSRGPSPMSS